MGVFRNYILWCSLISWFAAQLLKFLFVLFFQKKVQFERFVGSGGMPSSHTALVTSLAISTAQICGVESSEFAISFILACVVIYDAMGVRREAGEHAKLLNIMMRDDDDNFEDYEDCELKEKLGHTPLEVLGGALLGIIIPMIISLIVT
ncbi:MAG: divergent PAP2 family protein [Acutalibacteraceae bacterium]|nr:divergent PAP2 family protein [Acutalibacteraceae bacterium]